MHPGSQPIRNNGPTCLYMDLRLVGLCLRIVHISVCMFISVHEDDLQHRYTFILGLTLSHKSSAVGEREGGILGMMVV